MCTPHLYDWDPSLVDRARETRAQVETALREEGIGLRLLLGFEVDAAVIAGADEAMIARLVIDGATTPSDPLSPEGVEPTPPWKGAILIETPFDGWPPFLSQTVFRLRTAGYTPSAGPPRTQRTFATLPRVAR